MPCRRPWRSSPDRTRPRGASAALAQRRLEIAIDRRGAIHRRLEERSERHRRLAQLAVDLEVHRRLLWPGSPPPTFRPHGSPPSSAGARPPSGPGPCAGGARAACCEPPPSRPRASDQPTWPPGPGPSGSGRRCTRLLRPRPWDPEAEAGELEAADAEWQAASIALVRSSVAGALNAGGARDRLHHLAQARSAQARLEAVEQALGVAQGWACTALSAAADFPRTAGLFDLVVIDEASQCGIAEVLPLASPPRRAHPRRPARRRAGAGGQPRTAPAGARGRPLRGRAAPARRPRRRRPRRARQAASRGLRARPRPHRRRRPPRHEGDGTQHLDVRGRQRRQDLARDAVLHKAGWQVVRHPAWRCLTDPAGVAAEVAAVWAQLAVRAGASGPERSLRSAAVTRQRLEE